MEQMNSRVRTALTEQKKKGVILYMGQTVAARHEISSYWNHSPRSVHPEIDAPRSVHPEIGAREQVIIGGIPRDQAVMTFMT